MSCYSIPPMSYKEGHVQGASWVLCSNHTVRTRRNLTAKVPAACLKLSTQPGQVVSPASGYYKRNHCFAMHSVSGVRTWCCK